MGRTAVVTTAVVATAAVGGYFYLSNSFETQVQAQIDSFISNPDLKADLTYQSLKVDLLSGTAIVEGITTKDHDNPDATTSTEKVELDIGFSPFSGTATIDGFRVTAAKMDTPQGKISLDSMEVRGEDLVGIIDDFKEEKLTNWPLTLIDVRGLNMEGSPPQNPTQKVLISLDTAHVATNDDHTRVDELLIDNFVVDVSNQASIAIDRYQIKGLDFGWITDMVAMSKAEETEEGGDNALIEAAALSLAKTSINYMGIDSFILEGFNFDIPMQGMAISIKEMSVKDLIRPADIVLGGTMKVDAFELKGMQNTSPQAMQILTLADLDTIRLDMASSTQFDDTTGNVTSQMDLKLDKLISLESESSVAGLKPAQMSEKLIAYQRDQMEQAFRAAEEGIPPQQDPFAQIAEALSVYTGYYDSVSVSLGVEDQGLLSRGLQVYSVLSGMPEDQLREQFSMMAIAQAGPLLGEGAPENLAEVIQAFMAPDSQPMRVSVRSLVPMTEEALSGITPQTWHTVFGMEMATAEPTGIPASE